MAATSVQTLRCPRCKAALPLEVVSAADRTSCPSCDVTLIAAAFPALFRGPRKGEKAQALLVDGEAGCFYHPDKKAERACDNCGRFVCALCDIELAEQHVCPTCVGTRKKKGQHNRLQRNRMLYDEVALALALLPLLIWPLTLLTAPAALGMAIYHWNKPTGVIPRSRIRFVLAILFALLEMAGWAALFIVLIT